ncbi:hypothetical protein WME99_47350 [Sorangium sp. So ce136]|uniref:hypothetical protein n=1 Tax=Sorangium sp. So ce136 TaxID=3133284 RepID=UPI003F08E768
MSEGDVQMSLLPVQMGGRDVQMSPPPVQMGGRDVQMGRGVSRLAGARTAGAASMRHTASMALGVGARLARGRELRLLLALDLCAEAFLLSTRLRSELHPGERPRIIDEATYREASRILRVLLTEQPPPPKPEPVRRPAKVARMVVLAHHLRGAIWGSSRRLGPW